MRSSRDIPALMRLKRAAEEKVAMDPALVRMLLAGAGGLALGGGIGAHLTHSHDEQARERTKNTAFGAGVATGLASPHLVGALNQRLNPSPMMSTTMPLEVP
jgi:hypothetical protein